jgi:photosystem II stability/assembly factor-like uncharacterized protein
MFTCRLFIVLIMVCISPLIMDSQTIPPGKEIQKNKIRQSEKLGRLSPGGNRFSPEERENMYKDIGQLSNEAHGKNKGAHTWELVGPTGIFSADGSNFICSGRVRDIEILDDNHVRVASASGGLWDIIKNPNGQSSYIPLSAKDVPSVWNGAVATDPFDKNTILLGTGEPAIRGGAGLWRSTDAGANWQFVPINGSIGMGAFDEIEFTNIPGQVWCCGSDGVFFSEDSGLTWKQKRGGNFPGMVVYPFHPDTVLISEYQRGIFRTRDGGATWQKCTNGLPATGFYRVELANCKAQPDVIYALFTKNDHTTLGIYKTVNGGDSWTKCTVYNAFGEPDVDYHWGMAWYCSFISVSPANPNHVFSGGGWYIFSEDGQNFYGPTQGQHPDFHCGGWSEDGKTLWTGNDGGVYSTAFDKMWKWQVTSNDLPVTQFVTVAVSRSHPEVIIGGTQDNGLVYYSPAAGKWFYYFGDGGGVAIDPNDAQTLYGTIGVSGPPLTFNTARKIGPSAGGWRNINEGLKPSGQWWRLIRTDYNSPATLFTQLDNEIYYSYNQGEFWHHLNLLKLPVSEINSMRVSLGEYPKLYVSGPGPDSTSLMQLDLSTWDWKNITKGLPARYGHPDGLSIPHIFVSGNPLFPDRVFAVMRGYGNQIKNKVIFKSDDGGNEWKNISGNLPDLPFTVLLEHPGNEEIIIAGTDGFGIYITEDGGQNWQLWDDDLPKGCFITDIDFQKFSADSVYAVISTYGNSIYRRLLPDKSAVSSEETQALIRNNIILSSEFKDSYIEIMLAETTPSEGKILRCFSMDGKCLFEKKLSGGDNQTIQITLPHYVPGLYIINVTDNVSIYGVKKCIIP